MNTQQFDTLFNLLNKIIEQNKQFHLDTQQVLDKINHHIQQGNNSTTQQITDLQKEGIRLHQLCTHTYNHIQQIDINLETCLAQPDEDSGDDY